jgi:hypothetical protein
MNNSRVAKASIAAAVCQTIAVLICLLLPSTAAAQVMVPVTVRISELVQLNHDQDPGLVGVGQSLGDFYAQVSINGTTMDNRPDRCDNPPADFPANEVFDVPYVFFSETDPFVDPSCRNVPWTFTVDVPLDTLLFNPEGIDVVIKIFDDDSGLGGDDDRTSTVTLKVPFGGRWTGTKNWPDNCDRPAVEGSGTRVCWQIDVGQDSDGDGLLDDWETSGVTIDGVFIDLPGMGANPNHKDAFVELDWRAGFPPQRAEVLKWKEALANAPVDAGGVPNPDGLPGITLHVDTGSLTENGLLVGDNLGGGNELAGNFFVCSLSNDATAFYPAKRANFNPARALIFRYGITSTRCCLFGPAVGQPCTSDAQCPGALCQAFGGQAEIGGNDLVVWNTIFQGDTLLHELGHTLNLHHGGADDHNCKPNYVSSMNYDHQGGIQRLDGSSVLDFAPPRQPNGARGTAPLADLVENALSESVVLDPADPQTLLVYTDPSGRKRQSPVGAPVDWNGDGALSSSTVAANIDTVDAVTGRPSVCANTDIGGTPLKGHDDWLNVSLPFVQFGESADGPVNPVNDPEPTDEQILEHRRALNTTDLAISATGPAGPYEAGTQVALSYTLQAVNNGVNPALPGRIRNTPPPSAQLLSFDPGCVADAAGGLTCDLAGFLPGNTATRTLSVLATAGCQGGLPTPIVNQARIDNAAQFAGPDPQPANNVASVATAVVDTTPPGLVLSANPAVLWPPSHKFVPVTITVTSTDVCDSNPTIRLISITSNEGTNAPGSGHASPDIQGATFGTDDRQFELRAERSGGGSGRVYTITYEAEDHSGNKTRSSVTVTVPKSQGNP